MDQHPGTRLSKNQGLSQSPSALSLNRQNRGDSSRKNRDALIGVTYNRDLSNSPTGNSLPIPGQP